VKKDPRFMIVFRLHTKKAFDQRLIPFFKEKDLDFCNVWLFLALRTLMYFVGGFRRLEAIYKK
jgi:hypothetical protein